MLVFVFMLRELGTRKIAWWEVHQTMTYIAILESGVDLVCKSLMYKIYTIMLDIAWFHQIWYFNISCLNFKYLQN